MSRVAGFPMSNDYHQGRKSFCGERALKILYLLKKNHTNAIKPCNAGLSVVDEIAPIVECELFSKICIRFN